MRSKRCPDEDVYQDGASRGGNFEGGQEVKGKSYCYRLPRKERLIGHNPWKYFLWRHSQEYKDSRTPCERLIPPYHPEIVVSLKDDQNL